MMDSESDSVIVKSIVELAHNLGLKVVAEGIERSETLTGLAQMGADTAQGFFIGAPTPASHFEDWLRMRQDADSRPRLVAIAGGAH
jgi:EAL domain-containing protein (putative c-di-GMP-specific phosphodiesterase class I)